MVASTEITYSVKQYCDADAPYYRPGCEACRRNARVRARERADARGVRSVDAGQVRAHLLALGRAGWNPARIAAEAGIGVRTVLAIRSGRVERVFRGTADRIRAIAVPAPARISIDGTPMRAAPGHRAGELLVNARPVRLYLLALRELGMRQSEIARAASAHIAAAWATGQAAGEVGETPPRAMAGSLVGRFTNGQQRWCELTLARAMLAVEMPPLAELPAGTVHVHGSRRRLRGLAVDGHTLPAIAEALGVPETYLRKVRDEYAYVGADRARDITIIAEHLNDGPLPTGPYATKARRYAEMRHWLPLDAWHDEVIDDPYGLPDVSDDDFVDPAAVLLATRGERTAAQLNVGEQVEAVRRLAARGHSDAQIAAILRWETTRARPAQAVLKFRAYHGVPSSTGEAIAENSISRRRAAARSRAPVPVG